MVQPIITFENVSFQYHSQAYPTLENINLTINQGEKVLIIGASGSGKSTFINCINGLIPYKLDGELNGEIEINGITIENDSFLERSDRVGTVLQDTDDQFIGLTAAEDIAFILENNAMPQTQMKHVVAQRAKEVNIFDQLDQRPQDLSGGQKQRVALGGVLVHPSSILVFDEPLANLDPKAGQETLEIIESIHQSGDKTILVVEHRLEEALDDTFDRVILFEEGKIIANVKPDQLLQSDALSKAGIREPLYVTALKYANVPLKQINHLANIHTLNRTQIVNELNQWINQDTIDNQTNDKLEPILTLTDVSTSIGNHQILNNVTTTFYEGEMISIVGHNGAGKSSLAKVICGFLGINGTMQFKQQNLNKMSISERAQHIGYVMQNPNHMISQKMIFDEIALGLRLRHFDETKVTSIVHNVLKVCGLYPFRNWPISALSYGQKKRVTIAAILALDPSIIILDEPTAGQDLRHYTEMMEFLKELNESGKTIIMITHDMHLMTEYTQRSLVVAHGTIITDDTPVNLLANAKIREIAALRKTSLYTLADMISLNSPQTLVQCFINSEKKVNSHE